MKRIRRPASAEGTPTLPAKLDVAENAWPGPDRLRRAANAKYSALDL